MVILLQEMDMGFIRNALLMAVGFLAIKTLKRAMENIEAQKVKIKAKADEAQTKMPNLKFDPVTGVYRPEV
jgi:L-2-hydroxyglutarate oxidase LhgO